MNRVIIKHVAGCLAVLAFATLLASCKTATQPVVWTDRVGKTTYQQVAAELGPPDITMQLPRGGFVAEWVTRRAIRSPFGQQLGHADSPAGARSVSVLGPRERVLRLIFDQDGKLIEGRETFR